MTAESPKNDRADRYNAREAEARWQKAWDEAKIFACAGTSNTLITKHALTGSQTSGQRHGFGVRCFLGG